MKTATIVRDKISGTPFAILLGAGQNLHVYGAIGQGDTWAQWFKASNLGSTALEQLDVSLSVEKDIQLSSEYIDSISNVFSVENINDIRHIAFQKALLVIQHTKSLIGEEPENYEQINEINEEEEIGNWPVTDAALAAIDVAYKQIAIEYKAKAFNLDINRSSIILQVKGARAMWDPNMPGGGGWRCPDDTPFGGQYTNRIGRGCTFGAVRRIGRSLMTAALKDITKPLDGSADASFPKIYRLGQELENRGIQNQENLQEKYKGRVGRRVEKLQKRKAKEQLKAGAVTWRQAYQSLGPQMSRRGKAKIAAARVAERIANDTAASTFNTETRRAQRRQGRIVEKSPIKKLEPDVNSPVTIESILDTRVTDEQRQYGGRLKPTISNYGGVTAKRSVFGGFDSGDGDFILVDFDEMIDAKGFFARRPLGSHMIGETKDLPKFITMDEAIFLQGDRLTPGRNLSPKELYASRFNGYNPSTYEQNPGIFGIDAEDASRKKLNSLYQTDNPYSWVADYDVFKNLTKSAVDYKIPENFRKVGGRLPANISRQGFYVRANVTKQILGQETKLPDLLIDGETFIDLDKMIPQSALPEVFDKIILAQDANVALHPEFASYDFVTYDEISRMTSSVPITSNWDLLETRHGLWSDWVYIPRNVFEREYKAATGMDYNNETRKSTLRDRLADSLRNSAQNILEGRRMNRRILKDKESSLADRIDFNLRQANSLEGNPDNPILEYRNPDSDSKLKTSKLRNAKIPREETGLEPQRPNIVSRFLDDDKRTRQKERREIVRQIRGNRPRSTEKLSERLALWARRTAKNRAQQPADIADYETYILNRAFPRNIPRKKDNFVSFRDDSIAVYQNFKEEDTDPLLLDYFAPDASDSGLLYQGRVLSGKPKPSGTDKTLPTSDEWWDDKKNWAGLRALNDFFHAFKTHYEIAKMRELSLADFDDENQKKLRKIYDGWMDEFNDPDGDLPQGGGSNMGKTKVLSQIIKDEGSPSLTDKVNEIGYRHTLIATDSPNSPIVYIEDTDAKVSHLLDREGNHVLTLVRGDYSSKGNAGKIYYIAGAKAYEQIIKDDLKPNFRERLYNARNRKDKSRGLPVALRSRQREFERSSTRSGITYGVSTTGTHLRSNQSGAKGWTSLYPGAPDIPDVVKTTLLNEAKLLAREYEREFRELVKNFDTNNPLNEDEILDAIDRVKSVDARKAGVYANKLHNLITLNQLNESKDLNYIQNLKPKARLRLLDAIKDERDERGEPYIFALEKVDRAGLVVGKRIPFVPYDGSQGTGTPAQKPKLTPSTFPIVVNNVDTIAPALQIGTGPTLVPGQGSPELGIIWDPSAQMHFDTNTDTFVEDLSNLQIGFEEIYKPIPIEEVNVFPEAQTTSIAVFPTQYIRLVPGADLGKAAGQGLNDVDNPDKIVIGNVATFSSAIREFIQSEFLSNRIKSKANDYRQLFGTALAKIDFRGQTSKTQLERDPLGRAGLFDWNIAEIAGLAQIGGTVDERLSELDGDYLREVNGGAGLVDFAKDNQFTLTELGIQPIDPTVNNAMRSLDSITPEQIYLPAYLVGGKNNVTNDKTKELTRAMNTALMFDAQVNRWKRALEVAEVENEKAKQDGLPTLNTAALQLAGTRSTLKTYQDIADTAWLNAHRVIEAIYKSESNNRNTALKAVSRNPKNKTEMQTYLRSGAIAEIAEMMLQEHFLNNPRFTRVLRESSRVAVQKRAISRNARKLRDAARALARKSGLPFGGRNEGIYDDQPEILDPHGTPNPPAPRSFEEITDLVQAHKADSMFPNPINGITKISDEQVEVLSNMRRLDLDPVGLPDTPYEGIISWAGNRNPVKTAKLAHFWYYNGYNSLPVLVSEEELLNLIGLVDDDGLPMVAPISRGIRTGSNGEKRLWAAQALRGDRFIPGQGGQQTGSGEYYSLEMNTWQDYRNNGSTLVTLIPRPDAGKTNNLGVKDTHTLVLDNPRELALNQFMAELFMSTPRLHSPLLDMHPSLKDYVSYPSVGGDETWGTALQNKLTDLNIKVNATTGEFTPKQLANLQNIVDELTDTDQNGLFTVEGIFAQFSKDRRGNQLTMWTTLMLDIIDGRGPEDDFERQMLDSMRNADIGPIETGGFYYGMSAVQSSLYPSVDEEGYAFGPFRFPQVGSERLKEEARETREQINAWLRQYLNWFVDMAGMMKDESVNPENRLHNEKIRNAMSALSHLETDIALAMHGIDSVVAEGVTANSILPSQIWASLFFDPNESIGTDRILVHNRSASIILRQPVEEKRTLGEKIKSIMNTIMQRPITAGRGWDNL